MSTGEEKPSALCNFPAGVDAALLAASDPSFVPKSTLFAKELALDGRVAIVTGGGRGLGLEMAAALAEAGATMYCFATKPTPNETWKTTQAYISKLGLVKSARLEYASVDVSDQKSIWAVTEEIATKEGRLDICVASAGISDATSCLDITAAQFEKTIAVNVNGVFYTAQAASRQMVKLGTPGSIIIISSIAGSVALEGTTTVAYGSSKAAEIQMARSLACELASHGIRVNSLSPGHPLTEMIQKSIDAEPAIGEMIKSQNPTGRIGKPSELRGIIVWLASDASLNCTGSDIHIDGGHRAW